MFQAHSFLWQYLWLAPNVLGLGLVVALWRRALRNEYPLFFSYLIFTAAEQFCLYALDLSPKIGGITWWSAFWIGTIVESVLKFSLMAEMLQHLLRRWPSIAKLVRNLVSGVGVLLVSVAAVAAAFTAPDNTHWLVGGAHVLLQTLYFAQAGLIVSIFLTAAYFRIPWDRYTLGIALGFGVVWCEHLAVWALVAGGVARNRNWVDVANMATYHLSVLIWYWYLLVPEKSSGLNQQSHRLPAKTAATPGGSPENNEEVLEDWNRELERLIHQ